MDNEKLENNLSFFLLAFLPISILIGPSISLINIILINVLLIIIFYKSKFFGIFKNFDLRVLLIIYLYLIFNLFISIDYTAGLARSLGFLRLIGLFIFINYFFYKNRHSQNLLLFWLGIISIMLVDVYIEYFSGSNIFGWGDEEPYAKRVVSFFKDEPISGAFLSGFILMIFGYLLTKYSKKKIIPIAFLLMSFFGVYITGERSNTIKLLIGITLMFLFLDFFKTKTKLIILLLILSILSISVSQSKYFRDRYLGSFLSNLKSKENIKEFVDKSLYFQLYKSGISVFMNYPIFGVGNKNYRVETCNNQKLNDNYICMTHPHQIYIELLSEHGLFGTVVLLGLIFLLMFKILKNIFISKNYIQNGTFLFLLTIFTPILPSGAFFGDFNATIFWINFSIMFACTKETNIFNNSNIN